MRNRQFCTRQLHMLEKWSLSRGCISNRPISQFYRNKVRRRPCWQNTVTREQKSSGPNRHLRQLYLIRNSCLLTCLSNVRIWAMVTHQLFSLIWSLKILQNLLILNAFFVQLQQASTMSMSRHCEQSLKDVSYLSRIYFSNINVKAIETFKNVQNKEKEDPGNFKWGLTFSSTLSIIPRQEKNTNRTAFPLQSNCT